MNEDPEKGKNPPKTVKEVVIQPTDEEIDEEKEKKRKMRRTWWVTRAMADKFTREDVLRTTLKEALLFCFFVVTVTLCTIGRRSPSMFYLVQGLKRQFIQKEFESVRGVGTQFDDITTIGEMWEYCTTLLMDGLYWKPLDLHAGAEEETKILFENQLLGVPRIRQVKVRNDSCEVYKDFRHIISSCYNEYNEKNEDRSPFGPGKGTAWTYSSAEKTGSTVVDGYITEYGGGGYYQDLSKRRNESIKILNDLRKNVWITRGTRAVFVDFSLYNGNINLFCICKFKFEIPPTGGVKVSHAFRAVQLLYFVDRWDYVTFVAECATYAIMCYYILEELREFIYFKHLYLIQFWAYIDVVTIAMAAGNLATSLTIFPRAEAYINQIEKNPNKYGNLEYLNDIKRTHNNYAACLLFFAYIKLFKYLNFNKIMGQLNNTLKRCALDILGFSLMFFIIFFAYAQLGHVVFGHVVEDFRNFGVAMFTLLRTILGDFNFEDIDRASKVMAPLYFLTYIFLVFFVLLNMFLAIINDTYADVKTEITITPDEMQMTEFVKRGFYKALQLCGCKVRLEEPKVESNEIEQQIRQALREYGFNDLEIEMFFARYNIDPLAEMGDHDIKQLRLDLEAQRSTLGREELADAEAAKYMTDLQNQQERLERLEQAIRTIIDRANVLLQKLEEFESVRRQRT